MRLGIKMLVGGLAGFLAIASALAQPASQSIERWMGRQQEQIESGVSAGTLTPGEARVLRREQREIRDLGESLREDGYPPHEAQRILGDRLRRADRHLYDLLHNDDYAYRSYDDRPPPPPPGEYGHRPPPYGY